VFVPLDQIGWAERFGFVDLDERRIEAMFKLVPWEHLLADPFGRDLAAEVGAGRIRLIEPAWKMLASNKRLLVTLKEMYPDNDLLLDASTSSSEAAEWGDYVRKPVTGREGANVTLFHTQEAGVPEIRARQAGAYGDDLFVYQRKAELACAHGNYAVLGSWVVNRQACGMGVRESDQPITSNTARFVPHVLRG
jgi:glutathionylspermidine synthase